MHPMDHAITSARTWGGSPEDYLHIHQWFDETKAAFADFRHRALRHHSEGIFWAEAVFGVSFTNSVGKLCHTRYVAEQHIKQDCAGRIPSAADWLREIRVQPWMAHGYTAEGTVGTALPPEEPAAAAPVEAPPAEEAAVSTPVRTLTVEEDGAVRALLRVISGGEEEEGERLSLVQVQLHQLRAAMRASGIRACTLWYEGSGDSGDSQLGPYEMEDGTKRNTSTPGSRYLLTGDEDEVEEGSPPLCAQVENFPAKRSYFDEKASKWVETVEYSTLGLEQAAAETLEMFLSAMYGGYANNEGGGGKVILTQEDLVCAHYWNVEAREYDTRRLYADPPSGTPPLPQVDGASAAAAREGLPRLREALRAHALEAAYVRYDAHAGGWRAEVSYATAESMAYGKYQGDLRSGETWAAPVLEGASMDNILPEALLPIALQMFPHLCEVEGGNCVVKLYVDEPRWGTVGVLSTAPVEVLDAMVGLRLPAVLRNVSLSLVVTQDEGDFSD